MLFSLIMKSWIFLSLASFLCVSQAIDFDFSSEQVCYVPDIDLVKNVQELQSIDRVGLFMDTIRASTCQGRALKIESCSEAVAASNGITTIPFQVGAFMYRRTEGLVFNRITEGVNLVYPSLEQPSEVFQCVNTSLSLSDGWFIEQGDVFAAQVSPVGDRSTCKPGTRFCPGWAAFEGTQMDLGTVGFTEDQMSSGNFRSINSLALDQLDGFINARVKVVPTPPPIPLSCWGITPPLPCPTAVQLSSPNIILGRMESSPAPDRRFWGGGTYIMPQRVPANGTAVSFSYTALLNTQRTILFKFLFGIGVYRLKDDIYTLIHRDFFTIKDARPQLNHFEDTLSSDSVNFPSGWNVIEGDQFAVFILNECSSPICPAQLNFLNKNGDCQAVLYLPHDGNYSETINASDPLLMRVPITINLEVTIEPNDENFTQAIPPGCEPAAAQIDEAGIAMLIIILIVASTVTVTIIVVFVLRRKRIPKVDGREMEERERSTSEVEECTAYAITDPLQFELSSHLLVQLGTNGRMRRSSAASSTGTRPRKLSRASNNLLTASSRTNEEATYDYARVDFPRIPDKNAVDNNGYISYIMSRNNTAISADSALFSPAAEEAELVKQLNDIGVEEIPESQIELETQIGKGQFGVVYKALWQFDITEENVESPQVNTISAHVAVKVMEGTPEERVKFLQEAVLVGQFNDPNIISVFGIIVKENRLLMICELMDRDLKAYLTNTLERIQKGEMSDSEKGELPALLLSYCRKVASSFVYLGLKGFVHRDLAARNILVSSEGDCKIADFGMSREIQDNNDYYKSHGGLVPVKWTAPEAIIHRRYSEKSDVWSYGILLFEIWSLGQKPYGKLNNQEIVTLVGDGYRLPPPPGCPRSIYELLIKCTHPQPESRPTFTNILVSLQRPDYQLLKWADSDVLGRNLGDPLRDGEHLYTDLQNTYKPPSENVYTLT